MDNKTFAKRFARFRNVLHYDVTTVLELDETVGLLSICKADLTWTKICRYAPCTV